MRIAIVVNTSWNIYNFRLGLANAFLENGFEVIAIAPKDSYSEKLKEFGLQYYPVSIQNKGTNPIKDLLIVFQLYKLYRKVKPDIVLHYTIKPNIYGSLVAKILGIPVINNVSGLGTVFLHHNFTSFLAKKLYKIAFLFPKKIFFQNNDDRELFIKDSLVAKDRTGLLPGSGVDTIKFFPPIEKKKNSAYTFLMVARLLYDKGVLEYIEAIKILKPKYPQAKFQLMGAIDESANLGVSKKTVDEWVKQGLVEYFPFSESLLEYYHQADCVILPSYREGTPRALLEAASCGLPLVATNVPGCKDVVKDGENGFLCNPKDSFDLSRAIEKMLTLSEIGWLKMSEASRLHILQNFDEKIVINRYLEEINSIIQRKDKL